MQVRPLGMGLPLECSCCFLPVLLWLNTFASELSGERLSGGAAAGSSAGLGPLLVSLHSVSHGQSPTVGRFPALPGCGQRRGVQAGMGAVEEAAVHLEVELAPLPSFPMELSCSGQCQQQLGKFLALCLCTLVQLWACHQQHGSETVHLVQLSSGAL